MAFVVHMGSLKFTLAIEGQVAIWLANFDRLQTVSHFWAFRAAFTSRLLK
jgi:hypothetical protein